MSWFSDDSFVERNDDGSFNVLKRDGSSWYVKKTSEGHYIASDWEGHTVNIDKNDSDDGYHAWDWNGNVEYIEKINEDTYARSDLSGHVRFTGVPPERREPYKFNPPDYKYAIKPENVGKLGWALFIGFIVFLAIIEFMKG